MGLKEWLLGSPGYKKVDQETVAGVKAYIDVTYGTEYVTFEQKEKKRLAEEAAEKLKREEERRRKQKQEEEERKKRQEREAAEKKAREEATEKKESSNQNSGTSGIRFSLKSDDSIEELAEDADRFVGGYKRLARNYVWDLAPSVPIKLETFADVLIKYINESGMTNVDIYKRANLSKSVFSGILSKPDRLPKKSTVVALAIALKLDLKETERLLMKAGYTFSNTIVSDLVVVYFINKKRYDIDEINSILHELNEPLLGSKTY